MEKENRTKKQDERMCLKVRTAVIFDELEIESLHLMSLLILAFVFNKHKIHTCVGEVMFCQMHCKTK